MSFPLIQTALIAVHFRVRRLDDAKFSSMDVLENEYINGNISERQDADTGRTGFM